MIEKIHVQERQEKQMGAQPKDRVPIFLPSVGLKRFSNLADCRSAAEGILRSATPGDF